MKVCTDACILGAWFAERAGSYKSILDIGSGTGLQMLMLAQKSAASIDGIEIDEDAYGQLCQNISGSKWSDRLQALRGDARSFNFPQKYDFIISNPPFFENDLQSPSDARKKAMHSTELSLQELLTIIEINLDVEGAFGILLPFHRWEYFDELASRAGFHLQEKLTGRQSPTHQPFRAILHYSKLNQDAVQNTELIIHDQNRTYTPEFTRLLQSYYLNL